MREVESLLGSIDAFRLEYRLKRYSPLHLLSLQASHSSLKGADEY